MWTSLTECLLFSHLHMWHWHVQIRLVYSSKKLCTTRNSWVEMTDRMTTHFKYLHPNQRSWGGIKRKEAKIKWSDSKREKNVKRAVATWLSLTVARCVCWTVSNTRLMSSKGTLLIHCKRIVATSTLVNSNDIEGIVALRARIIRLKNSIWEVSCYLLKTKQSLLNAGKCAQRNE